MDTAEILASAFHSGLQRARVCRALLTLVDATDRWTPTGPAPDARVAPARSDDADGQRMLAACWALWEGSSTLTFNELLLLGPARLEAVGQLLAALARGSSAIDEWLARWEVDQDSADSRTPSRRAAVSGRLKLTR